MEIKNRIKGITHKMLILYKGCDIESNMSKIPIPKKLTLELISNEKIIDLFIKKRIFLYLKPLDFSNINVFILTMEKYKNYYVLNEGDDLYMIDKSNGTKIHLSGDPFKLPYGLTYTLCRNGIDVFGLIGLGYAKEMKPIDILRSRYNERIEELNRETRIFEDKKDMISKDIVDLKNKINRMS